MKAMRLEKISGIEEANAYLPKFIADYNRRFGYKVSKDAHREAGERQGDRLNSLLTWQEKRLVGKTLSLQYRSRLYQIKGRGGGHHLKGKLVDILVYPEGRIELPFNDKVLDYEIISQKPDALLASDKTVNLAVDKLLKTRKPCKPDINHPWRKGFGRRRAPKRGWYNNG